MLRRMWTVFLVFGFVTYSLSSFVFKTPALAAGTDSMTKEASKDSNKDSAKEQGKTGAKASAKSTETPAAPAILQDTKLSYPELEVTPRASDRLEMEAKNEARNHWLTHLPIQLSALATFYAGTAANYADGLSTSQQDNYNLTKKMAVGVGVGWLVLTTTMSALYKPYFNGYKDVVKMPATNSREDLTRERIAEEALYAPDSVAVKLKWFSFATNLGVNLALLANEKSSSDFVIATGALASFAPLLFDYRWTQIANQHREYKKKIYGPIAFASPIQVSDRKFEPGLGLLWLF